jgi:hypothetical protein
VVSSFISMFSAGALALAMAIMCSTSAVAYDGGGAGGEGSAFTNEALTEMVNGLAEGVETLFSTQQEMKLQLASANAEASANAMIVTSLRLANFKLSKRVSQLESTLADTQAMTKLEIGWLYSQVYELENTQADIATVAMSAKMSAEGMFEAWSPYVPTWDKAIDLVGGENPIIQRVDKDGDGETDYVNLSADLRVAADVLFTNDVRVDGKLTVIVGVKVDGSLEAGCITDNMSCLVPPYCNNNKMCNDYDDATVDACEWSEAYLGYICTNMPVAMGECEDDSDCDDDDPCTEDYCHNTGTCQHKLDSGCKVCEFNEDCVAEPYCEGTSLVYTTYVCDPDYFCKKLSGGGQSNAPKCGGTGG